jgi:hypothetical protein
MSTAAEMEWTPTRQAILGHDPALQLYGEVSVWFHKLHLFRRGEHQRIYHSTPTAEDLAIHKSLLLRLIADGEHLLLIAQQSGGLIANSESIKIDDLRAGIESLRDTFRGLHQPLPVHRRDEILREAFGNVA